MQHTENCNHRNGTAMNHRQRVSCDPAKMKNGRYSTLLARSNLASKIVDDIETLIQHYESLGFDNKSVIIDPLKKAIVNVAKVAVAEIKVYAKCDPENVENTQ